MPCSSEYEVVRERYLRLRHAAERVVDAASYQLDGADEARGEPQPNGMAWMSVS